MTRSMSLFFVAFLAALGSTSAAMAARCSDLTGTYGVYFAPKGGKAVVECRPGDSCKLWNGTGWAWLLPAPGSDHNWYASPIDATWVTLNVRDSENCKHLTFSNGTLWKLEN